jgi:hypothetical protein
MIFCLDGNGRSQNGKKKKNCNIVDDGRGEEKRKKKKGLKLQGK